MKVETITRYLRHTSRADYEPLPDMHCPACGGRSVWHDMGAGDYYVGETHVCVGCRSTWTMQGPYDGDGYNAQIIDQIVAAIQPNASGKKLRG